MLEERNFKTDLFAQYPNQQQIAWPRLDSVKLDLKDLTFRSIEKNLPSTVYTSRVAAIRPLEISLLVEPLCRWSTIAKTSVSNHWWFRSIVGFIWERIIQLIKRGWQRCSGYWDELRLCTVGVTTKINRTFLNHCPTSCWQTSLRCKGKNLR